MPKLLSVVGAVFDVDYNFLLLTSLLAVHCLLNLLLQVDVLERLISAFPHVEESILHLGILVFGVETPPYISLSRLLEEVVCDRSTLNLMLLKESELGP